MDLVGNGIVTKVKGASNGSSFDVEVHAPGGHNATFATKNADGFAYFECGPGDMISPTEKAYIVFSRNGYKDTRVECSFPLETNRVFEIEPSNVYPIPSGRLIGSLIINGPYPKGPRPGASDNALFVDEIDTLSDDVQDQAIAQIVREGSDHISLGPIVAAGYHRQYDDTNWVHDHEGILKPMRKARAAGLNIVFTVLPDVEPYFHTDEQSGGTWDWALIERDFTPLFESPEFQQLMAGCEIQSGWENMCMNAEFVKVFTYLARVFPTLRRWWHSWPNHSSAGLSSEPISEGEMARRVKAAGCTGYFLQDASRALPDGERNEAGRLPEEQFEYNTMDGMRHCNDGYGAPPWPGGLDVRMREYNAFWRYNDNAPAGDWGTRALKQGAIGAMDGGFV